MKTICAVILTFAIASVAFFPAHSNGHVAGAATPASFKPGEVIVKLKQAENAANENKNERAVSLLRFVSPVSSGAGQTAITPFVSPGLNSKLDQIVRNRGIDRLFVFKLDPSIDVQTAVNQLRERDDVEYAEPNYLIKLATVPNDPRFSEQWALMNLGIGVLDSPSTLNADIKAYLAWDVTPGAPDVVVAVTDTGVDAGHPDLQGSIYTNPGEIPDNGIDDDKNGYIDDVHGFNVADQNGDTTDAVGHGTQMAGLIAARLNNETGIAGISQSKILPVRFFKKTGPAPEDYDATVADAARALLYSIAGGASIINASWRTLLAPDSVTPEDAQALRDAVGATDDAGVLLVCIAGNEGFNNDYSKVYPGAYALSNEIVVAASDFNDDIWHPPYNPYFIQSGFGKNSVHLAAPGLSVLTTLARGECLECSTSDNPADWYGRADGTSVSAAIVSGVAALVKSHYPSDSAALIKKRILDGVQKLSVLEPLVITGGRVDAAGALAVSITIVPPVLTKLKYKKGSQKLILTGEKIQEGVHVVVGSRAFSARLTSSDGTSLKLKVPASNFPEGVAVPVRLRNPDGGESQAIIYTR